MTGMASKNKIETAWIGGKGEEEAVEVYTDASGNQETGEYIWAYWIPKWDKSESGQADWCSDIGQAESLAVLRAQEKVIKRKGNQYLMIVMLDSRAALSVLMGRNLNKVGNKLEGEVAAQARSNMGERAGLILIWNKAHTNDLDLGNVDEAKQLFFRTSDAINAAAGTPENETKGNEGEDAMRTVLERWKYGNFVADFLSRSPDKVDENCMAHTWLKDGRG